MSILAFAAAALTTSAAIAGSGGGWKAFRDPTVQDHGFQWSRVGDPGNAPFVYDDPSPFVPPRNAGRTNYKYRIMTREVTVREWFGFVQAYAPYVAQNAAGSSQLLGGNALITFHGFHNGLPQYSLNEANADRPMIAGWRFAARFANWLHNDQADAAWAFETGAYDTSTFGSVLNDDGVPVLTDQAARAAGSKYWIPNLDEWSKAGFYDPNRHGEGNGGWWQYPTTSDTAPVSGHPDFGGETNGGTFPPGQIRPLDVGSYPNVQSPWGLLDVSGGASEWIEDFFRPDRPTGRVVAGTTIYDTHLQPHLFDLLGAFRSSPVTALAGVRLASVIPAPGTLMFVGGLVAHLSRRHRCAEALSPERAGRARS